jgi:hypothetical protein
MRRLFQVLSNMDAQAWRTLLVSFVLFGGVGMVFLFGAQFLGFDGEATVERWLALRPGSGRCRWRRPPSPSWRSSACPSSC